MMQGKAFRAILLQAACVPRGRLAAPRGRLAAPRGRFGRAGRRLAATLLCCSVLTPCTAVADAGLGALSATRERPLFSPSRRPPPPPVVATPPPAVEAAPPPELPPPNLLISGIVTGSQEMALVKHPQDQTVINVSRGTAIDGWTVSSIGLRSIVLQHDRRSVTITLPDHDQ